MPHSIFGTFYTVSYTVQKNALVTRFKEETEVKDHLVRGTCFPQLDILVYCAASNVIGRMYSH